jgi:starvation-inducible DNA-binding protein
MKLIKQLKTLQADSYILMLKTHSFHWNVTGANFQSLHTLFETMYNELFLAVDTIAERIRALDSLAVGSYSEFQKLSKIKDSSETKSKKMIKELIDSNELLIKTAQELVKLAQKEGDEASADLAIERITIHQKNIWMLKAHLKE